MVPALYRYHKGEFQISAWPHGNPEKLTPNEQETVNKVLKFYGHRTPQWLSDLTHMEAPWIKARKGVAPGDSCQNEITLESMSDYYASI